MRKQKKVTYAENIVNTEIRIAEIQMNRDPTMFNVITDRTPNTQTPQRITNINNCGISKHGFVT